MALLEDMSHVATIAGVSFAIYSIYFGLRSHNEKMISDIWRDFDKVTMEYCHLYVAGQSGEFDFEKRHINGDCELFEKYIWYLSLLVFNIELTQKWRGGGVLGQYFFVAR